ncbi:MAG: transglycosylase domain-containing protein [Deltaproteobacteria bacterium]|nr:transglycosylase domain-containing protein [Deltaproteobacteria bacterium]
MAMPPGVALRARLLRLLVSKRVWGVAASALLVAAYPLCCGALGGRLVSSKLSAKLGVEVEYDKARAGWGSLSLWNLTIGPKTRPLLAIVKAEVSLSAAWGSGTLTLVSPRVDVQRGGPEDNTSALLRRLRKPSVRASGDKPASYPRVVLKQGSLRLEDAKSDLVLTVASFDGVWESSRRFSVMATEVDGRLGRHDNAPSFSADAVTAEGPLTGLRPHGFPQIAVEEGKVQFLPNLPLTGITGSLRPTPKGEDAVDIMFSGSYAGAKRSLWTATGKVKPTVDWSNIDGQVALRAERFSLDKIADVLPASVLEPENTEIDAAVEARFDGRRVALTGKLDVAGLSISHQKLAAEPVLGAGFTLRFDAAVDRDKRRLNLGFLEGKIGSLTARLAGSVELPAGVFRFKNGRELKVVPKIDLSLRVPRARCAKILASIPAPLVPSLQGFALQGQFEADVHAKIDFADLDALALGGKVGIDGCQVVRAPAEILALAGPESLLQTVEVPPPPSGGREDELFTFSVGPDNPDFVPFENISPYLIAAIMTTEDSGFFKHRGWVSPQFKTALQRNIAGGGFRLGASSITMQMVKNVILGREKTLSRKFQELFLAWYVEKLLSKERILELYFNAIEFGPRLYGIGAAARHYFGKTPADLTPLEAAFFSSILPSPKRRYAHYCRGVLSPQWEKYLRRILSRMHERGRLDEEEFTIAMASTLSFDRTEMTLTEKQCMDWVRRITARPGPEPEPEADGQ